MNFYLKNQLYASHVIIKEIIQQEKLNIFHALSRISLRKKYKVNQQTKLQIAELTCIYNK
jgi:hypothetical protein